MKSILKLIKRFIVTMLFTLVLLFFLNLFLFLLVSYRQAANHGAWSSADTVASALTQNGDGTYQLSAQGEDILSRTDAWAILVDNETGYILWNSSNLPEGIPTQYSAASIAMAVRGYINDYPVTSSGYGDDLILLGFPKNSYWKLMSNTFDLDFIKNMPKTILLFLGCNLFFIFFVYMIVTSGVLRSVRPVIQGIESLPSDRNVYVKEKGLLSDLAISINKAAEKLRNQDYQLRKKETARANWIAGVSHDIRTPLSMVMGYASQIEENRNLPERERNKARIIRQQSLRMKNLVNDLNLASKLEYNVQPLHLDTVNLVSLVRQTAVDFLNLDLEGKYPIQWIAGEELQSCYVKADKGLLRRAVSNLITNSQVHNPDGCTLSVSVGRAGKNCRITVWDNGVGVTDEELARIQKAPHYMVCDRETGNQRHGLGLMLVRQIAEVHGGGMEVSRRENGGFQVVVWVPGMVPVTERKPAAP